MAIAMGIDIGQRREPSALCVAEAQTREADGRSTVHHLVRHLERLPVGTPFPEVARRAAELSAGIRSRAGESPRVYINATGLGQPVVDLFEEAMTGGRSVVPVFFTHGDRRTETMVGLRTEILLGKAFLVTRLQTLLQTGRLHLPRTAEAETLARELREYEIEVTEDANDRYGAFRVGTQDDLITALGLAVQQELPGPGIY
jgi:hypothetical protein